MPNGSGIEKSTFVDADEKTRIAMTFDLLSEIHDAQQAQISKCDKRFKPLERRKWFDKGIAGGIGAIGGFMAGFFR